MDSFMAAVDANIRTHGWHATGVFPTEDDVDTPPFTYSAGLAEQGLPEVIVLGLSPTIGHGICANAVDELKLGRLSLGRVTGLLHDFDAYVIEVSPGRGAEYLGVATVRAREREVELRCWQIVWPDTAGLFPWQLDYNIPMWVQPVLGPVD